MKIYFGYGSNLDFDDWSNWCSRRNADPNGLVELQRALLPGYNINYSHHSVTRKGGAANLCKNEHNLNGTYGVLFRVNEDCLDLLDEKEGHPNHYRKTDVQVITDSGEAVTAITYISSKYDGNSFFPPKDDYHTLIYQGLLSRNLPTTDIKLAKENDDNSNIGYIVAYGTLKRGQERGHIMPGQYICEGIIKGDLFDLGPYPGIVDGSSKVSCEVYFSTNLVEDIGFLDRIEGTNLNPPLYQRKLVPIDCNDGILRYGICYFYNGSLNGAVKLVNGVWS